MTNKLKTSISHTHPLAYIQQPDILHEDRSSFVDIVSRILYAALPTIICFLLNITTTIINIFFVGNYGTQQLLIAVGIGSVITSVLGFILLQSMNMGFAAACVNLNGLPDSNKAIGLMYQKALVVNFFLCILITPTLYLSDRLLLKIGLKQNIVILAGQYIWGLVPSFYLYCFYDTTRNYIQSQGQLYPPLIIQFFTCIVHFALAWIFIKQMNDPLSGAIWSKNISDALNSLLLYIFIIKWEPTKQTWIQWSIQAATNWTVFIQIILSIGISSYLQSLAFQLLSLVAAHLSQNSMIISHIIFSNTLLIINLAALGISHCISYSFFCSLKQNKILLAKKKLWIGIIIIFCFSLIIGFQFYINQHIWFHFFTENQKVIEILSQLFPIFIIIIFLEPFQISLAGFLRSMDMGINILKIYFFAFYIVGIGSGIFFAFYLKYNVFGIWIGWILGLICSIICFWFLICRKRWQQVKQDLDLEQEKIKQEIRKSFNQNYDQEQQRKQKNKKKQKKQEQIQMTQLRSSMDYLKIPKQKQGN